MEQPYLWFYFFVFGIPGRCFVDQAIGRTSPSSFFIHDYLFFIGVHELGYHVGS
jgi:hypothetical protein